MRAYKCEKKAEEILVAETQLEYFIPKRYAVRVYHGVKSRRLVPVIPGLVFVRALREELVGFKKQHNFLQFVMWKKSTGVEHLVVPDGQMQDFIRIASLREDSVTFHSPEEINIEKGTRVRIHGGRLDGVEGLFMQVKGKRNRRVVVLLDGVVAVAAEVHPDLVEVIR